MKLTRVPALPAPANPYRAYLQSPEWRATRQRYLDSKLSNNCIACGKKWEKGFHFHHKTYKNLGHERLMDIVPMCPECHDRVHRHIDATGINVWYGTKRVVRKIRRERRAQQSAKAKQLHREKVSKKEAKLYGRIANAIHNEMRKAINALFLTTPAFPT